VAGLGADLHIPPIFKHLVRPEHGGETDPLLPAIPANGRQPIARAKGAPFDEPRQLVGEALVQHALAATSRTRSGNCSGRGGHMLKLLRFGPAR
jgi:hypothetical protein